MGYLSGLQEYLDEAYAKSVFDQALNSEKPWTLHLHGERTVRARILENLQYDLKLAVEGGGEEVLPKIQVAFLYPAAFSEAVGPILKIDKKTKALQLSPILSPRKRYFIKNKSLFPLMVEKEVLFFTLLDGVLIKGIIAGFSRYEIDLSLKGGVPVTILRHSIFDLRNKKGRCFLKSFQEERRDWEKSELFVP